jgi:PAB-dependent poly(A)-specific ribonuclease subunit 3
LYNNPNINLKGWANPYNLDGAARPFSAGKTVNGARSLGLLPEHTVWDFVVQLSNIIRTIHASSLACRVLTPSRLLLDHKTRLRLSGVGIFDVLDFENNMNSIAQYQVIVLI